MRIETKNFDVVRRSARLADRFRPGAAAVREARGVSVVGSRVCSTACSVAASALSRAPHRAVRARARDTVRGGAQPRDCGLPAGRTEIVRREETVIRTVSVVLERCLVSAIRPASFKLGCNLGAVENEKRETREIDRLALRSALRPVKNAQTVRKTVRFADPTPPHTASGPVPQEIDRTSDAVKLGNATTGVRILQLNMRRSAVVTGEVRQLVVEKRLDVLLLQEPHVRKQGSSHTFVGLGVGMKVAAVRSQRPWAAVAISNPNFQMLFVSQLSTTHCVCVEVQAPGFSFYVASCYFQYSDEIEGHLRHLEMVLRTLRGKRLLIAVDSNARSSLWGPQRSDERGEKFEELIRASDMHVLNRIEQGPTFWTARGSSYIDVTLGSSSMSQLVGEWKIRNEWSTSDHKSIDIRLRVPKRSDDREMVNMRFDIRRADWERFAETLTNLSKSRLETIEVSSADKVEEMAETLTTVLTEACTTSMPRKRKFRKSNPWWTQRLTSIKKKVVRYRRAFQEGWVETLRVTLKLKYRLCLREYRQEVKKAKLTSWRKFVTSNGNLEPWGFVYKQQACKLRVEGVLSTLRCGEYSTKTLEETASYLLDAHIPDDREIEDTPEQREIRINSKVSPDTADAPSFTALEIAATVRTFKNNKAPGLDLVEVVVLKTACNTIPGQFVRLFNGCLQWGVFPSIWKEGSLRVLLKGEDKDERDPKSYRPICLLSVIGKLFEKLLKARLLDTSLAPDKVSRRQFGFMPGRSAEDAVVELRRMVSASEGRYAVALLFDISGAFDNVWWPLVLDSLRERDCPRNIFEVLRSYFDDRKVKIAFNSAEVSKRATRGCPQGSVLGPACWNLMFDGLLKILETIVKDRFAAYADDLVVVVNGNSRREIEAEGQRVVNRITEWCRFAKLQISERKTEAIILKSDAIVKNPIGRRGGARPDRKRKNNKNKTVNFENRPPIIKIGKTNIRVKQTVRYLGVHLDRNLKVRSHCEYLNSKVGLLFAKLGRLARAQWGLRFRTLSTVYRGVFAPTVAYAAAGWADLCTESDIRILRTLQRRVLISTTGAYRTASWESLCVVAGATPVDIVLKEYAARYKIRKEENAKIGNVEIRAEEENAIDRIKDEAINMWQTRWTSSHKGRTTFAFFKDVRERLDARLETDHYSTQVLTGHGNFRAKLEYFKLVTGDACICKSGVDTAQHFLLECPLFDAQREALRSVVPEEEWRWPGVAHFIVSNPEVFAIFVDYCRESLWLKGYESVE